MQEENKTSLTGVNWELIKLVERRRTERSLRKCLHHVATLHWMMMMMMMMMMMTLMLLIIVIARIMFIVLSS